MVPDENPITRVWPSYDAGETSMTRSCRFCFASTDSRCTCVLTLPAAATDTVKTPSLFPYETSVTAFDAALPGCGEATVLSTIVALSSQADADRRCRNIA